MTPTACSNVNIRVIHSFLRSPAHFFASIPILIGVVDLTIPPAMRSVRRIVILGLSRQMHTRRNFLPKPKHCFCDTANQRQGAEGNVVSWLLGMEHKDHRLEKPEDLHQRFY